MEKSFPVSAHGSEVSPEPVSAFKKGMSDDTSNSFKFELSILMCGRVKTRISGKLLDVFLNAALIAKGMLKSGPVDSESMRQMTRTG